MCTTLNSLLIIYISPHSCQRSVISNLWILSYSMIACLTQVLSTGIQGVTLSTSEPIVYRIHADHNLGLLPDEDE